MNEKETMEYIEEINKGKSVLGLDNIHKLLEYLGNPQNDLKFIHIAGTNGKGSTLSFISTILKCAGMKVGRYLSPTIFEYRERFQINAKQITKADLVRYMTRLRETVERMQADGIESPTAFEIETALAFLYFKEKACDIVVLETGLGGRLDATNVINTTVLAVITSIGMDHMAFLGDSIGKIAYQKAGIIKKKYSVVSAGQEPEAMEQIVEECRKQGAFLRIADMERVRSIRRTLKKQSFSYQTCAKNKLCDLQILLLGSYQIKNAILAIEAIEVLREKGYPVSDKALRRGLLETEWMGRFSVIGTKPLFIADGAHNEAAAIELAETIQFYFTNKKIVYIMGILKDKEYDKIIRNTYSYAEHIITVKPPNNPRAMSAYELAQEIQPYHKSVTVADSVEEAVEISYLLADKESVIIAFGSLSYLGKLITIVQNRKK